MPKGLTHRSDLEGPLAGHVGAALPTMLDNGRQVAKTPTSHLVDQIPKHWEGTNIHKTLVCAKKAFPISISFSKQSLWGQHYCPHL